MPLHPELESPLSSLNQGYVTNVEYTHGYYGELNPVRAAYVLATAGFAAPKISTACELGFGQGVSISIHSAAQEAEWWGTDFNPQHTMQARALSDTPEAACRLEEQGFADFCARSDLPDFDFIGLHGVWSWISVENQDLVIDFVRRKLRPGGVLYVSYNTFPGWADAAPIRHLLKGHVDAMGARASPIPARIDDSLAFLSRLAAANPAYFRAIPRAAERLKALGPQNRNYVAHEYLTDHWNVCYFADFARRIGDAKVSFACSANPLEAIDSINLPQEQQIVLNSISDRIYRESIRDFCVNQQFRKDLWVKGALPLNADQRIEMIRNQRIILCKSRQSIIMKLNGAQGEVTLHGEVYNPLLEFLGDHAIRTVGELETAGLAVGIDSAKTLAAVQIMLGMGIIEIAQDRAKADMARAACTRLNAKILARADIRPEIAYLASPVTGGAIAVQRFEQLFLASYLEGSASHLEWAEQAWARIAALGQALVKDGEPLVSAADNLAELTRQAQEFSEHRLPILKSLGIA